MRRKIVAFLLAAASVCGFFALSPVEAGAVPVPCPVGNQGWFEGYSKVYHCVVDGNHLVIAQYGPGGLEYGSVVEAWLPGWVTTGFRAGQIGVVSAEIEFCQIYQGAQVRVVGASPPSPTWDYNFQLQYDTGYPIANEGVLGLSGGMGVFQPGQWGGPTNCGPRGFSVWTN